MQFEKYKLTILVGVVVVIIGSIAYLESFKVNPIKNLDNSEIAQRVAPVTTVGEKEEKYSYAKEITTPDGFINTDGVTVEELIGEKIILVDFWTYSCINCQRTTPFLNAWHEKYSDEGLVILGLHTPEFEFEKKYENVVDAVERFNIEYPVILDNDFSTWYAYNNRYWPRKYLIDIDGYIVYDHIGEGGYEETERVIQELLKERSERLNDPVNVPSGAVAEVIQEEETTAKSPEVYFGAWRNELLANGKIGVEGRQSLSTPSQLVHNNLYLHGDWDVMYEFSTNLGGGSIVFTYTASKVHMVASGSPSVTAEILIDGKPINDMKGIDVSSDSVVTFDEERLYNLVDDPNGPSTHILEIRLENPGLQAYTFTFG